MVLNYTALAATYLWLRHAWREARAQRTA
jgi:hypothetical protein